MVPELEPDVPARLVGRRCEDSEGAPVPAVTDGPDTLPRTAFTFDRLLRLLPVFRLSGGGRWASLVFRKSGKVGGETIFLEVSWSSLEHCLAGLCLRQL